MKVAIALLSVYIVATSGRSPMTPWVGSSKDLRDEDENEHSTPCGVSKAPYDGRKIVGTRGAMMAEFPWQVSLRKKSWIGRFIHICSGAVIGRRYILTAAHCVEGESARYLQVSKIIAHERYDSKNINNDIAILVSSRTVLTASEYVNNACLPRWGSEPTGTVTVTGWAVIGKRLDTGIFMQAVDLPLVSVDQCRATYGSISIADSMMCAGVPWDGEDSDCQLDSGGPVVQRVNGKAVLVGIVAWGYGCAGPSYPGVYTQVSRYLEWIENNIPTYMGI